MAYFSLRTTWQKTIFFSSFKNDKEKSFIYRSVFVVSANVFPADRFTYYLLVFFLDWIQSTIPNVFETKSMRKKKTIVSFMFHCFVLFFVSSYYFTGTAYTFDDFSIPSNRSGSSAPTTAETWLSISRYYPETAYFRILYVWRFSSKRKVLVFYYLFWIFHHFHSWRMIRMDFVVMALPHRQS